MELIAGGANALHSVQKPEEPQYMNFMQRVPNFVEGVEPLDLKNVLLSDILSNLAIKTWETNPGFRRWAYNSMTDYNHEKWKSMLIADFGSEWWVVGYLSVSKPEGLPLWMPPAS